MGRTTVRRLRAALLPALCLALLCALTTPAFADGEKDGGILDQSKLQTIAQEVISQHGINEKNISIGYCYLATGDTWYYNNDTWFYAASVYKVPLMMLMAEKVYKGELTQDSVINGATLAEYERLILTYSNNDYARDLRFNYFGGDEVWGEQAQSFSDMPAEDYDPNFLAYRYYNARYIIDVLKTLYGQPERFPNVADCLLEAEPGSYFRSTLEGQYDIAQKYGAFEENDGTNNNHAVGIIYTPNPIAVSVMTKNFGAFESVIGDVAQRLVEYTLSIDSELEAYEKRQQEEAALAQQEADEAARKAQEQEKLEAEQEAQRLAQAQAEAEAAQRRAGLIKWLVTGAAVLAAALTAVLLAAGQRRKKRQRAVQRREAAAARRRDGARFDRETRQKSENYAPKH